MKALFWLFCVFMVANGLWMLVAPEPWCSELPAAVPDTGPFNPHFVRDVGVSFAVLGVGFGWCAANLERCYPVYLGLTADIAAGRLSHAHCETDALPVFVPAALLLALSFPPVWRRAVRRR